MENSKNTNILSFFHITDSRKIVDTRNRIIHGYDTVSSDVIWMIAIKYLPVLEIEVKEQIEKIINLNPEM